MYEYGISTSFYGDSFEQVSKIFYDRKKAEAEVVYLRIQYPDGTFNLYERECPDWNLVHVPTR